MQLNNKVLKENSSKKIFINYAIPSMLGMLMESSAVFIDGLFVANFISSEAFSAIGIVWPITALSFALYVMLTLGSIANTPITATITSVSDTDNTFDITVTNNNPYEVKYKIKEENDLYNVDYSGILNSYITIPANTTKTIRVVFSGKQDVIY